MPRGGSRPGAGRPKKAVAAAKPVAAKKTAPARKTPAPKKAAEKLPSTNADGTKPDGGEWSPFGRQASETPAQEDLNELTPLDYLLQVMRTPTEETGRRMQAATLAAPYVHAKKGEGGKKEQKDEAAKKVAGRFAVATPPKLVAAAGRKVQ